jgi:hypothetical protein
MQFWYGQLNVWVLLVCILAFQSSNNSYVVAKFSGKKKMMKKKKCSVYSIFFYFLSYWVNGSGELNFGVLVFHLR